MATPAAIPAPTFCRLETWDGGAWTLRHEGINLLYPRRYVERLAANGKVGRVIIVDSGEIIQLEDKPEVYHASSRQDCPVCGDVHYAPFDGSCLL